jgi:hypothetical protein
MFSAFLYAHDMRSGVESVIRLVLASNSYVLRGIVSGDVYFIWGTG